MGVAAPDRSGCRDIFASEDQHGTWKTVLTRSASRAQLFWAKTITALAFAICALVVLAASTIATACSSSVSRT
jgi:ABC-2 type transport system permease protein